MSFYAPQHQPMARNPAAYPFPYENVASKCTSMSSSAQSMPQQAVDARSASALPHEMAIARAHAYAQAQVRMHAMQRAKSHPLLSSSRGDGAQPAIGKPTTSSTVFPTPSVACMLQQDEASPITAAVMAAARRSRNKARSASNSRRSSPEQSSRLSDTRRHGSPATKTTAALEERQSAPAVKPQGPPVSVEWRVAIDPRSKRPYYYHPVTRETTWKKPQELIEKEQRDRSQFFSVMEQNIRDKLRAGNWLRGQEAEQANNPPSRSMSIQSSCSTTSHASDTDELSESMSTTSSASEENQTPTAHVMGKSKSVPTTPEPLANDGTLSQAIPAAASKPPLLFRTLSSYETPVVQTKKGKLIAMPSPIPERVRLSSAESNDDSQDRAFEMVERRSASMRSPALVQQPLRRRSNSTSTIFVRMGTMNAPDQGCTIQCVATVMRAHMLEAQENPISVDPKFDLFINRRDQRLAGSTLPTLKEIAGFMTHVYKRAQMESECIIMSLIYVERLLKATIGSLQLQPANWRSILFCSMVMASKVWDDLSMCNADFSKIWPELSLKQINELECAYLSAVEYKVRVSAVSYAKYYFQLRSMCASMGNVKSFDESAPLNLEGAQKMQVLSEEYQERSKLLPVPRRRSVTITSASVENKAGSDKHSLRKFSTKHAPAASIEQLVHMQVRGAGGSSLAGMHRLTKAT